MLRRSYYQAERRLFEAAKRDRNPDRYYDDFGARISAGDIDVRRLSLRALFEEFVSDGAQLVRDFDPRFAQSGGSARLVESAVDTSAFSNITGQIVYSQVLEAWQDPAFIGDQLCTTIPTQFSGEKIPGVSGLGDEAEVVNEGGEYPLVGNSEEWIETPETTKRGFIVPVTKEAIFFDRTGLVLQRASETARWLRINKEKRILDVALGVVSAYKRNGMTTAIATYNDNSGTHDWDNLAATNALVDWTDVENAMLLFDGVTDPNTGEPISVMPRQIVVPSALLMTARRVVNATEIRFGDGASASTQTIAANPIGSLEIVSNPWVKARTSSATTWFLGDFRRAFAYMENWPITTVQAPVNSEMEFTRDIVSRFKVSERGAAAVIEPRYVVKCTA